MLFVCSEHRPEIMHSFGKMKVHCVMVNCLPQVQAAWHVEDFLSLNRVYFDHSCSAITWSIMQLVNYTLCRYKNILANVRSLCNCILLDVDL